MAAQAQQAARKKLVHQLDTPFSTVSWPEISLDDQNTILELLCNLLRPIGQHRRAHIKPSKGKRALKRKNQDKTLDDTPPEPPSPPKPELDSKIDVGFNSITRQLEALSSPSKINSKPSQGPSEHPCAMIFVARGNQSSAFNCHFPQMVAAAAKHLAPEESIRLVGFSRPCSERLSTSLGIARVSSVAIARNAPGAEALWKFVQEVVQLVDIAWIKNAPCEPYRKTEVKSMQTKVGEKRIRSEQGG